MIPFVNDLLTRNKITGIPHSIVGVLTETIFKT